MLGTGYSNKANEARRDFSLDVGFHLVKTAWGQKCVKIYAITVRVVDLSLCRERFPW